MREEKKISEIIKTIAVAVLLVMLVCLCILYMLSYQSGQTAEFTKAMMERLSGESIKYQYLDYLDEAYLMPDFIGFSVGNDNSVGFYGSGLEAAYEDVRRFYAELFSPEGTVTQLTKEEGDAAFAQAMRGRYIYVGYFCDLPKSVIAGAANTEMIFSGVSGEFIKEIFIVPERYVDDGFTVGAGGRQTYASIYSFCAVARDSEGRYYRYTTGSVPQTSQDVSFNTNYYLSYNTSEGALRYTFAAVAETDAFLEKYGFSDKISDTTVIFEESFSGGILSVSRGEADARLEMSVLNALYLNPERVNSYTDEAGVKTYFDEGRSVRFTPGGEILYTALGEEGISFEEIFGYSAQLGADVFDYIGAALILSNALEPVESSQTERITLFLSGMEYDGATLRLAFGYRYDGIPVLIDGRADALVFEMSDGMVKSVSFSVLRFEASAQTADTPDFMWLLRGYLTQAQEKRKLIFAYLLSKDGESCGPVPASVLP